MHAVIIDIRTAIGKLGYPLCGKGSEKFRALGGRPVEVICTHEVADL